MADNLTLLELHLHAEDNEFTSDLELTSDVGDLVRDRLGFGETDDEQSSFAETDFGSESDSSEVGSTEASSTEASADGGNTVQVGEGDEDEHGAVVEIDETVADEDDESGGRSKTRTLLKLLVLAGVVMLVRRYLGGDDEFENEFEEL
ncbi:hypothetical protein MUK72_12955 [Halococcus dombrowskii]|uniref:PGF-CTERM protein n=1 Tax=Halococcus dombrowskii TaxID=179637 RepID=A0AAV3SGF0_HALDO|nr:hypothetical protein [Halococcus dombrowskii]UOO94867.1 hypothetical protein MUK72_12955 [Halococcus dombrowskii]